MEAIASALEKVVAKSLRRATDTPVLAWPLACGGAVAERTRALAFRSGVLWVEVPDAGWRRELKHLVPNYVVAINKFATAPVERIEFVIAGERTRSFDDNGSKVAK